MDIKSKITKTLKILSTIIFTPILVLLSFHFVFFKRNLPNTYVAGVNVGGLTTKETEEKLKKEIKIPKELEIKAGNQNMYIDTSKIELTLDSKKTAENAYLQRKNLSVFIQPITLFQKKEIEPIFSYENSKLENVLNEVEKQIDQKGVKPEAQILNEKALIINGKPGIDFQKEKIKKLLELKLASLDFSPITLDLISDVFVLDQHEELLYKERVEKLIGKKLILTSGDYTKEITDKEIARMTDFFEGYDKEKIKLLSESVKNELDSPPQNPVFIFEEGIVKEFRPAKDGILVNSEKLKEDVLESLKNLELKEEKTHTLQIPTSKIPPDYKTEEVNNLGIKELIGIGKSKFVGSIPQRVSNIKLASSKLNGILIKPDEIFSFNSMLGEVSKSTGYQQAYIIKEGQTVLGDGGGVCQVSTTLFRAALNAGLPIIERQAHAYRVSYYEQDSPPGFDATVFDPTPDFKFKNDTGNHILIQAKLDSVSKTLVFEIYGTKDGRDVYISKPVVSSTSPPPEDVYIEDPTLPKGQVKQIDWKAWGAKVWFDYKVTKNGTEIFSKRFYSNYRPWQAKFLIGTGEQL